jgi:hypothetical protein
MNMIVFESRLLLVLGVTFSFAAANAATTYEAESSANTLTGAARIAPCGPCSGGYDVGWVGDGNGANSSLQFNGVNVTATGSYQVSVFYSNGASSALAAYLSVNGGAGMTQTFTPTGSWWSIGSQTVTLTLTQGTNSIKFYNPQGYAPDIDMIQVSGGTPVNAGGIPLNGGPANPPVISGGSPTGALAAGTTQTTLNVTSDTNATCKFATAAGFSYASMPNLFSTTGGTSHSTPISGLVNGGQYSFYVRCMSSAGVADTSDYGIAFSIAQPAQPVSNNVSLLSFGAAGQGGDDTAVFQTALNSTALQGKVLEIPVAARPYNIQSIYLPANTNLLVDAGVVVQATPGYSMYQSMINIEDVSNVVINATGSTFQMNKAEYTTGEYRDCTRIAGASNVTIQGMTCNNSGGDGIYIGGSRQSYSYNVTVQDSTFNNNRRDGMSLVSGQSIYFRRCHFTNSNGTPMEDGIDIEPNFPTDRLVDIHIEDSFSTGNNGDGIAISLINLTSASQPLSITILRHTSANNGKSGYMTDYEVNGYIPGVSGSILIANSSSTMDGTWGAWAHFYCASGPSTTFQNITVTNANQKGTNIDNAAVGVVRGGGGIGRQGNVFFLNPAIIDTTGKLDYYYSVEDFSGAGETKIQFVSPVQLSGARRATSTVWGVVDGAYAGPVVIQ